jgi:hypothetical protein
VRSARGGADGVGTWPARWPLPRLPAAGPPLRRLRLLWLLWLVQLRQEQAAARLQQRLPAGVQLRPGGEYMQARWQQLGTAARHEAALPAATPCLLLLQHPLLWASGKHVWCAGARVLPGQLHATLCRPQITVATNVRG